MKKSMPAILIATICFFFACKKPAVFEEPAISSKNIGIAPQQLELKCGVRENAAKSALAMRNMTSSNEPVTLLLDFNGHKVNNTNWNGGVPFYAQGVPEELLSAVAKQSIMQRVIEDFSAFNVKVTRSEEEYRDAPANRRMRCIISQGLTSLFGNFGGLAFISSLTWADDTPCFVFVDNLLFYDKYIAEATSHELGHTFGLYHQSTFYSSCELEYPYNPGVGSGDLSWAPIMGLSYYANIGTWHLGLADVAGCSALQNDIKIIKDIAPFKPDDHGERLSLHTTELPNKGTRKGILENANDKDAFLKDYQQAKRITVSSNGNSDLALEVYSLKGQLLAVHDDLTGTNVDVIVTGKKYLKVRVSYSQPYVPAGEGFGGYTVKVAEP